MCIRQGVTWHPAQVLRGCEVVHEGNIVSLRRVKDNVQEVLAQHCHISQCLDLSVNQATHVCYILILLWYLA